MKKLTLKESMELAGKNLISNLSSDHGYLPFFFATIDENKNCTPKMEWPTHNIGRWWDALLRLEAATGFVIPPEMEDAMLRNLKNTLSNSFGVCCFLLRPPIGWIDGHSLREILLALACLVRFRENRWAEEKGSEMIRALSGYIRDDCTWDFELLMNVGEKAGISIDVNDWSASRFKMNGIAQTTMHGRLIEGLLEFYLATGDKAALELSERLAKHHFEVSTRPDGLVPEGCDHTHSLFGTYRGLLEYGILTRQHQYVERVLKSYTVTVRSHVKRSGFISHDWGKERVGETASPGDAAQLALWLSQLGYDEFLDDAEGIVRTRILPSQIISPLGLKLKLEDGGEDWEIPNVDDLTVGAFGGMHSHHHGGKNPTTDITAADLHTLCDIYNHIVENSEIGLLINFHFDFEDHRIKIETTRGDRAHLKIQTKKETPILIRMPTWIPKESITATVNGEKSYLAWIGNRLFFNTETKPGEIYIKYPLPEYVLDEKIDGVNYRLKWKGDEITGISPNTSFLPFYPSLNE